VFNNTTIAVSNGMGLSAASEPSLLIAIQLSIMSHDIVFIVLHGWQVYYNAKTSLGLCRQSRFIGIGNKITL
jgi:hypothetical protein